jgi:PII-like signaling protein
MKRRNQVVLSSLAGLAMFTGAIGFRAPEARAETVVAQLPSQLPALVDEVQVRQVIDAVIAAAGDIQALDALLTEHVAPFVMTEFIAETFNSRHELILEGRQELRAHMRDAYDAIDEIEYLESEVTTRFIEDGKVMVAEVSSLQRIIPKDAPSYISRNISTSLFTMVDGKLMVTSYVSQAQIDRRP